MSELDLQSLFPRMTPVKTPPKLFTVNGFGTGLYGERDRHAESETYVTTLCLTLLFIPCFCLRAYRVARAQKGWYFLGREPLSGLAKTWNALVLAAIFATAGTVSINVYTSSPAYKARQQMAEARKLVNEGHLQQAARIFQALATAGADEAENATAALKDVLDNQCQQAPLSESAGVFTAAAQVARRGKTIELSEVVQKGLKLASDKGDADPRSAVALLDAIRPLAIDTRPVDARRLELLRKWAASEPANLDVICPLASLLEQQDQLAEAKKLLLPAKERLGDGEGARVLGTILAREGDLDGAYGLLWPYVQARLDRLHAAEKAAEAAATELWAREIKLLEEDKGPRDFYDNYKRAGEDQKRAMVREYILGRIKGDPRLTGTQEALERQTAVVPVALELGIVMLQRAHGQADPAARKTQLESAEKVFLAIGGIAGESDEYRLSLGQVYYWLGRQPEGRKLFDDFLTTKGRSSPALLLIGFRLRQLGADAEARSMAEQAYAKASKPEEKYEAASLRALCDKDRDDRIEWLRKADTADPTIKASLAKALGDKAFEEGRDAEAVNQYRIAVDAYAVMPRSASSLNEAALAHYAIFQATGERQSLDRCFDHFQQAVELNPSDSILLYNAGVTLIEAALTDVIGTDIDLRALHRTGSYSLLSYLYEDQAGRDAIAQRVKGHPGIARALSDLEKVMVVAPKHGRAATVVYEIHHFARNEAGLRTLEQRVKAAGIDASDELASVKEFLSGTRDPQNKVALAAAVKRSEELASALRAKGGRTAAIAMAQQAEQMMSLDVLTGTVEPQKVVALAQEAYRLSPSSGTSGVLVAAHLFRAGKELRRTEPAFDALYQRCGRSVGITYLLAVEAGEPGPLPQKLVRQADFQTALAILREQGGRFPENRSAYEWAMLKTADAAEADKMFSVLSRSL